MKKTLFFLIASCMLFSGCPKKNNCSKIISRINKIIVNIDTSSTILVETGIGGNYRDSIKELIAESTIDKLNSKFSDEIHNKTLVLTTNQQCSDGAMLMEGKVIIINLDRGPFGRGKFDGQMKTKMINCMDSSTFRSSNESASNKDFLDTPKELGEAFGSDIYNQLTDCQQ